MNARDAEIDHLRGVIRDLVLAVRAHDFAIKHAIETGDTSADASYDTLMRLRKVAESAAEEIA